VHAAVEVYGVGAGASPMVSGHSVANAALELELADAVQLPRALYFYAGYATNASIVPALVGAGDALFSDVLNHACLIDGARLSKAQVQRFAHADLAQLDKLLAASPGAPQAGDQRCGVQHGRRRGRHPRPAGAVRAARCDAAAGRRARLRRARPRRGAARWQRRAHRRQRLSARALHGHAGQGAGVAGAFVAGPDVLVEWLLQKTRSYIYATAAPALLAEAVRASLRCVLTDEGERRRQQLRARVAQLRGGLAPGADAAVDAAGWALLPSDTAIQPLVIGDNAGALAVMARLHEQGLWVPAIRPPTVPAGSARLRIALSAAHSRADVDELLGALRRAARGL
jgi:8-amino-7-oxononanoate synthase